MEVKTVGFTIDDIAGIKDGMSSMYLTDGAQLGSGVI